MDLRGVAPVRREGDGAAPGDLGGVRPWILQRDGRDLLAVFTAPGRAEAFSDSDPYLVVPEGLLLLRASPPSVGFVVNPGSEVGSEMQADGAARIRDEIRAG